MTSSLRHDLVRDIRVVVVAVELQFFSSHPSSQSSSLSQTHELLIHSLVGHITWFGAHVVSKINRINQFRV